MAVIVCPHCKLLREVNEQKRQSMLGKTLRCTCGNSFVLEEETPPAPPPPLPTPVPEPQAVEPLPVDVAQVEVSKPIQKKPARKNRRSGSKSTWEEAWLQLCNLFFALVVIATFFIAAAKPMTSGCILVLIGWMVFMEIQSIGKALRNSEQSLRYISDDLEELTQRDTKD